MGNLQSPITHASRVYDPLRRDIVDGRFKAGEKLTINSLRNAYNVGLSSLREAFPDLTADEEEEILQKVAPQLAAGHAV